MNDAGLLWEAEILLEETIRRHASLPAGMGIDAAAQAVAAMRAAVEAGKPADPETLRAIAAALAALSAAVDNKSARDVALGTVALGTNDPSLRARVVRLWPPLLRGFVSVGMFFAFVTLVLAFIGFGILTGSLRDIRETNTALNLLVQKAPKPDLPDYCERLNGHNYETNLLKSSVLVDYKMAAHAIAKMKWPIAPLIDGVQFDPSIKLYRTDYRKDCQPETELSVSETRQTCAVPIAAGAVRNVDCDLEQTEQFALDILRIYETILLPMLFALFGVLISIARKISRLSRFRPFLPADAKECVASICAALFIGAFLAQILPAIQGDLLPSKLPPFALAFVVGFNIDAILAALGASRMSGGK